MLYEGSMNDFNKVVIPKSITFRSPAKMQRANRSFSKAQQLKIHTDSVHLGLRPHKCKACGKNFTQNSHLNTHYKTVHLNEKPY